MGIYEALITEEGGKEFGHSLFDELSPISAEQEGLNASINQMQHTTIQLNWDVIKTTTSRSSLL